MIGTVTLNPTVDRRYNIDVLAKNTVNRTEVYDAFPGGKGINAAKVLTILKKDVAAYGLVGGFTGDFVRTELKKMGVVDRFTTIEGTTRTCVNIIDANGDNIEVLEKGPLISNSDREQFLNSFKKDIKNLDILIIGGEFAQRFGS